MSTSTRLLNIYRASAGSGKTHLLTGFYLRLLFLPEMQLNPLSGPVTFDQILAVTFTNKATAEMKDRIIHELHILAETPQESHYWDDLSRHGQRHPDEVRRQADAILHDLLNDYSVFNVSTIDSFFQRIVRSFARELNVAGNYDVELDGAHIADAAIGDLLSRLTPARNQELYGWLVEYSRNRITDRANWDFRTELRELAEQTLTGEGYSTYRNEIQWFVSDPQRMKEYEHRLRSIVRNWQQQLQEAGQRILDFCQQHGITPEDFKGGSRAPIRAARLWAEGDLKAPSDSFRSWAEDPTLWMPKKSTFTLSDDATAALQTLLKDVCNHFEGTDWRDYMTAVVLGRTFYQVGLFANIDQAVRDFCSEQGVMLLSSSTELLSRLIGDDDAPFIYEKIGIQLKAFMIDEFQDTSGLQWGNFRPLLSDALGSGHPNLIVGDVKQSIYRWRGSDWGLLDHGLYAYEAEHHYDDFTTLDTNWRSESAIVQFNNLFFTTIAESLDAMMLTEEVRRIYKDVVQALPPHRRGQDTLRGYVGIRKLTIASPADDDGTTARKSPTRKDYLNEAIHRLPDVIIELQEAGFAPRQIAILCRRKEECQQAANALLQYKQQHPHSPYGMDIISGEALLLASRPVISAIIALMRHLHNPQDKTLRAVAWCSLFALEGLDPEQAMARYFEMPKEQRTFRPELTHRPLYELCEELIGLLPQDSTRHEQPFLLAFRDLVLDYANHRCADLSSFLHWWDTSGCRKSIATPESQDAIRIMTVHQSKGLGFDAVVMPFASWEMDLTADHDATLWCQPRGELFDVTDADGKPHAMHFPVRLSNDMKDTHFMPEYQQERLCAVIDNLNIAYVAFTRAKEAMILLIPECKPEGTMLENYLAPYCALSDDYESGTLCHTASPRHDEEAEACTTPPLPVLGVDVPMPSVQADAARRALRLPGVTICRSADQEDATSRHYGLSIHRALELLPDTEHIDATVRYLYDRGIVKPGIIASSELTELLHHALSQEPARGWFRPGVTAYNEMSLVDADGNTHRPDRVVVEGDTATVIDYKSLHDHQGYRPQVKRYMKLLRQMGFRHVKGYLWFLLDNRVVEVE